MFLLQVIKDLATLKNGQDYCLAGVLTIIGLVAIVLFLIVGGIGAGLDIEKLRKIFDGFFEYIGLLIGMGSTGKLATNKAES